MLVKDNVIIDASVVGRAIHWMLTVETAVLLMMMVDMLLTVELTTVPGCITVTDMMMTLHKQTNQLQ